MKPIGATMFQNTSHIVTFLQGSEILDETKFSQTKGGQICFPTL